MMTAEILASSLFLALAVIAILVAWDNIRWKRIMELLYRMNGIGPDVEKRDGAGSRVISPYRKPDGGDRT